MFFLKLCSTDQLCEYINKAFSSLKQNYPEARLDIYFTKNNNMSPEGLYVFSKKDGYHYVYSERGNETTHKITYDLFEISYWIFESITSELAFEFASISGVNSSEYRKTAFSKQLEMLMIIGEDYKKRGEVEINKLLKLHP